MANLLCFAGKKLLKPGWVQDQTLCIAGDNLRNAYIFEDHLDKFDDHYVVVGQPKSGFSGKADPNNSEQWQELRLYHIADSRCNEERLESSFPNPQKALTKAELYHKRLRRARDKAAKKNERKRKFEVYGAVPHILHAPDRPQLARDFVDCTKIVWIPACDAFTDGLWAILALEEVHGLRFTKKQKLSAAKEFLRRHPNVADLDEIFIDGQLVTWMHEADRLAKELLPSAGKEVL